MPTDQAWYFVLLKLQTSTRLTHIKQEEIGLRKNFSLRENRLNPLQKNRMNVLSFARNDRQPLRYNEKAFCAAVEGTFISQNYWPRRNRECQERSGYVRMTTWKDNFLTLQLKKLNVF